MVEVAKQMWPQEWPDLPLMLRNLYAVGPGGRDLVLSILRSLSEDIFTLDRVPAGQRKKDLSTAMTAITVSRRIVDELVAKPDTAPLIQFLGLDANEEGWLAKWTTGMVELQQEYEAGFLARDKARIDAAERLAVAMIQTIGVSFQWVLLKYDFFFALFFYHANSRLLRAPPLPQPPTAPGRSSSVRRCTDCSTCLPPAA